MKNKIVSLLFEKFEGDTLFDKYFSLVDSDEEDPYFVFHSFSELFKDLLVDKIKKDKLLIQLCHFINHAISLNDNEVDNVMKSEFFSVLDMNTEEKIILKNHLSERAFNMIITMYD